jgi:uncharacterized protein with von Willebrand factor type A (vWA) domain
VDAPAELSREVAGFTAYLRHDHGFGVGQAETHEALRAAELIGLADERRLRHAWRLVYSASPEEAARFDRAFEAFFRAPRGVPQPPPPARRPRTRPGAATGWSACWPSPTGSSRARGSRRRGAGAPTSAEDGSTCAAPSARAWRRAASRSRYAGPTTRCATPASFC